MICVQAQTYTDWELLVINDADSEDGTAEIVKMYGWNDPRIRLIQAESHLGLAESLNLGIREAHGKYIARLDADDTSKPERFAKQIKFLEFAVHGSTIMGKILIGYIKQLRILRY